MSRMRTITATAKRNPLIDRLKILTLTTAIGLGLALTNPAKAQEVQEGSEGSRYTVEAVIDGLDHPWGMAFLPNGDALITERSGDLRLMRDGALVPEPITGLLEVHSARQGGLLDVALHPDFASNQMVYLTYSVRTAEGTGTAVMRGRFNGSALEGTEQIFQMDMIVQNGRHYGSRIVFDRDGYLYVSIGDRGSFIQESQNLGNHIGTIVRLNDDGTVPADNPFIGVDGAEPEIFSYGHRNPQGMTVRPSDGSIWSHEHGPQGGDELNLIEAGLNYGWPAITYGEQYGGGTISEFTELPGMEQPVVYWTPSIAPSGMAFYDGDLMPEWQGDLFVGALVQTHLRRLEMEGDRVVSQEILLWDTNERIRDVRNGPDGYLYVLTDAPEPFGQVLRIGPAPAS